MVSIWGVKTTCILRRWGLTFSKYQLRSKIGKVLLNYHHTQVAVLCVGNDLTMSLVLYWNSLPLSHILSYKLFYTLLLVDVVLTSVLCLALWRCNPKHRVGYIFDCLFQLPPWANVHLCPFYVRLSCPSIYEIISSLQQSERSHEKKTSHHPIVVSKIFLLKFWNVSLVENNISLLFFTKHKKCLVLASPKDVLLEVAFACQAVCQSNEMRQSVCSAFFLKHHLNDYGIKMRGWRH